MFSICKRFLSRIEVLDRWFLALRLITIVVGAAWYLWVPYDAITRSIFGLLLAGFAILSKEFFSGLYSKSLKFVESQLLLSESKTPGIENKFANARRNIRLVGFLIF